MSAGELPNAFATRVVELAKAAFPPSYGSMAPLLIEKFKRGLRDPQMAAHVARGRPNTLQKAADMADEYLLGTHYLGEEVKTEATLTLNAMGAGEGRRARRRKSKDEGKKEHRDSVLAMADTLLDVAEGEATHDDIEELTVQLEALKEQMNYRRGVPAPRAMPGAMVATPAAGFPVAGAVPAMPAGGMGGVPGYMPGYPPMMSPGFGGYGGAWGGGMGRGGGRGACHRCGQMGHFVRECPMNPVGQQQRGPRTCHRCGDPGHFIAACPLQKKAVKVPQAAAAGAEQVTDTVVEGEVAELGNAEGALQ